MLIPKLRHVYFWGWFRLAFTGGLSAISICLYWKKVIKDAPRFSGLFGWLDELDGVLLKLPALRYLCWNTVIVLEKS